MKPAVKLQWRAAYGVRRIYPVNRTARLLAQLTGRVTLLEPDLAVLRDLGYAVEWVPEAAGPEALGDES